MKFLIIYIVLFLGIFSDENPRENPSETTKLTIQIDNIAVLDGTIKIGVFNTDIDFLEENATIRDYSLTVTSATEIFVIDDLPKGEYAISMYHDENSDGVLNRNFFGIPKEPYGFSNNVKPKLSAPDYKDCKFSFAKNDTLKIRLIH
ncbi:DUF2141 domain-containing protein [Subsaximicrobium wynnwilliamsii]|uniref:DUF2141 domain-containing protein n=1 Tax=Subsaximicrobium wynnwilliamsii TaxID=291179 RepID=A0A5C6ZJS7_9FLAO|nr:DUF2141 domain-containing protein [Subsaximicrobium wynnwilliamsii]TXD84877.1 DUF2141 domain-containing protein [Subsaximicrobium wynnwilliamsii]TXD90548.1 DUF2141 domain-containing protein [Subsaximicrobium wynnwilliamsii]TXE05023.1 DUF2141 domain-containing protein [Subsaximicrobium wynnwilliamsii]